MTLARVELATDAFVASGALWLLTLGGSIAYTCDTSQMEPSIYSGILVAPPKLCFVEAYSPRSQGKLCITHKVFHHCLRFLVQKNAPQEQYQLSTVFLAAPLSCFVWYKSVLAPLSY